MAKGYIISDPELQKVAVYFNMASKFGFTPEQVDKMDNRLVESLLIISRVQQEETELEARRSQR